MAHRYFTTEIFDSTAFLTGADAAHLARVLRARPGQKVVLCNGQGVDYEAEIAHVAEDRVELALLASDPCPAEPGLLADVFVGMAKGERMEYAVQKCVELGAHAIWPFYSEHSVVKPKKDEAKTLRYGKIAAEAAKQCNRGILPAVHQPLPFAEVLQKARDYEKTLFFYERGGAPLRSAIGAEKRIAVITGPEGGFSEKEAEAAAQAGCLAVGLGPRILRCETAPAAVLAALMCLTGNLE